MYRGLPPYIHCFSIGTFMEKLARLGNHETLDAPKMLEVYLDKVWQQVFCYALACEDTGSPNSPKKILMTIVAGSDSSLQALKGAMDIGSHGLSFGYGVKGVSSYEYQSELSLYAEKGSYEKFPMKIGKNRKALAIVHEDLLDASEYVLSFEGKPHEDIANLLGGSKYGLHLLDEWKEPVYQELRGRNHIRNLPLYYDPELFPGGIDLMSIELGEEDADDLLSELIQAGDISFPREGSGTALKSVDSLTDYMTSYSDAMVEKLAEEVQPTHDPTIEEPLEVMNKFPRTLFPVQGHVSSAISKRLMYQDGVIIQGEMSTGKTAVMTSIAEGVNDLMNKRGKEGYFSCVMVPPSLTDKWPKEIREIVPDAEIHVIKHTKQLIDFHSEWNRKGRPKPKKPTFFVISFTTMRNDARNMKAVEFTYRSSSN